MTRERLIAAAAESFRTKGYAATTVDDVVTAAGATRATFYLHFSSKVDLVAELHKGIERQTRLINRQLTTAIKSSDRDSIAAWLDAAFDFWATIRDTAAAQQEAAASEPKIRAALAASYDRAIAAITEGFKQAGRWDGDRRNVRAILMYSQLQNVFHRWMRVGWDVDRDEMLQVMTDMWMAAVS
jgi:AcrR family transcriptional regulator